MTEDFEKGLYEIYDRRRDYFLRDLKVALDEIDSRAASDGAFGGSRHAVTLLDAASSSLGHRIAAMVDDVRNSAYEKGWRVNRLNFGKLQDEFYNILSDYVDEVRKALKRRLVDHQLGTFLEGPAGDDFNKAAELARVRGLRSLENAFPPRTFEPVEGGGDEAGRFGGGPFFGFAEADEARRSGKLTFIANQFQAETVIVLPRDDADLAAVMERFDTLEELLRRDNGLGENAAGERVIAEVRAGRQLLSASTIRTGVITAVVLPALAWLVTECAGSILGDIAKALVKMVAAYFGYEIIGLD